MQVIAEIRRRHLVSQESISAIARDLKLSRPTVRKHLQTHSEVVYHRQLHQAATPPGMRDRTGNLPITQPPLDVPDKAPADGQNCSLKVQNSC